jgi:methionyl aminopeptidase
MKGPTLKSRDEIAIMDRANRIVVEILEMMREMVRPGVTTAQINAMAEEELAKRGAKSPFKGYAPMGLPPYPAVVCTSVNDVIVHGIPNRAKLQEGDNVGLDFGSIFEGFVGDAALTVPVGKVTAKADLLMRTTRECLELAIEEMRPGRHIGDIGQAVQDHAESRGFHVIRTFVGHGIEPMLCEVGSKLRSRIERAGANGVIQDVKTDADGWTARTVDGTLAAHFENSVAVTANGPLVLGK